MALFDRGGDKESAVESSENPVESGESGELQVDEKGQSKETPPDSEEMDETADSLSEADRESEEEESTAPTYVPYNRENPPDRLIDRFGDGHGDIESNILELFDSYANAEGRIREDVLELPIETLEEWDEVEQSIGGGKFIGNRLDEIVDERTVNVDESIEEDQFFQTAEGFQTLTNHYDLEKAVSFAKKGHFVEIDRYWVNKPYAFVSIFHSRKENETKYYIIEPYLTPVEEDIVEFLSEKLRAAIKYESDDVLAGEGEDEESVKGHVIEKETRRLLKRYDLYTKGGISGGSKNRLGGLKEHFGSLKQKFGPLADKMGVVLDDNEKPKQLEGITARPEPVLIEEDSQTLSEYQVEKLIYKLKRDFVGYERIDAIKHDINVEEISCDGYNSPVFVYHSEHESVITNVVYEAEDELDEFVVKLAQRSGKGISKRTPQVDATLPDGSRSQLTLGREVSDHGTNYTIRQFQDVPHTPIDLINWRTFSLDQMAFLWLAIENHKSLIFAGGTASGKTTNLNAVSLFIPSNTKIVSIEDTREVELPQRNWIASVTRPSFSDDDRGDIDEFDLLEAALRQRPDYIVMGEVRGEEGRTLFQVMSTGHTTYTTFHADTVGEVLKRFTTEPINVSKTLFTALDLVTINRQTRVQGRKVRKTISITEINDYNAENDEINVQDIFEWRAESDDFVEVGDSNLLDEIMFDRGWNEEELESELFKRRVVLAYLIDNGLKEYSQVAATVQAFMSDQDTILQLIAHDALEASLADLREMESVLIDIEPEKEALVPRPNPTDDVSEVAKGILERAESKLLEEYREMEPSSGAIERALQKAARETEMVDKEAFDQAIEQTADGEDIDWPDAEMAQSSEQPDGVDADANGDDSKSVSRLFDEEESVEADGSGEPTEAESE